MVGLHFTEVDKSFGVHSVRFVQGSDSMGLQECLDAVDLVHDVHLPPAFDGATSCHHQLVRSTRMHLHEFRNVINAVFIRYPDPVRNSFVFLDLSLAIDRPLFILLGLALSRALVHRES